MSLAAIMMEKAMPYVPHEVIVSLVLPRLPVASLLRFKFVCKAWRDTIDNDDDFHRQHLRLQNSSVLIALQVPSRAAPHGRSVTTAMLYWLEDSQKDAATLVHDMPYYHASPAGVAHDLAHCDGLVLLPTDTKVRMLNPATGRFVTLPWSTHGVTPDGFSHGHQAFGLGHDPSSNTYKVACFFYCSKHDFGMEVFTIGGEHRWRETAARPLYPVKPGRTATFFKGSLIWTVGEEIHRDAPGFLRFCLEDELSSIMAPPPCWSLRLVYASTSLAEIRGELCVCVSRLEHGYETMEMWMCGELGNNNVPAQWDWRRYVLANVPFFRTYRSLRLIGIFNEEIMFRAESYRLWFYSRPQGVLKGAKSIMDLKFHDPNIDILVEYTRENLTGFDAIPFVPSLVPV